MIGIRWSKCTDCCYGYYPNDPSKPEKCLPCISNCRSCSYTDKNGITTSRPKFCFNCNTGYEGNDKCLP